jgi:hypothetical protein
MGDQNLSHSQKDTMRELIEKGYTRYEQNLKYVRIGLAVKDVEERIN